MRKVLGLVVAASMLSGCSVALQKKPSSGRVATSECSTTKAYAIVDTVVAAAGAIATVYAISQPSSDSSGVIGGVGVVGGVAFLASAGNGYKWANQCRANQETAPAAPIAAR